MAFRDIDNTHLKIIKIIAGYLEESDSKKPAATTILDFKINKKCPYNTWDILRHFGRAFLQATFDENENLQSILSIYIDNKDRKYSIQDLMTWLIGNFPAIRIQPNMTDSESGSILVFEGANEMLALFEQVRTDALDKCLDEFHDELLTATVKRIGPGRAGITHITHGLLIQLNGKDYRDLHWNLRIVFPEATRFNENDIIIPGFDRANEAYAKIHSRAKERAMIKMAALHEQLHDTHGSDIVNLISEYDTECLLTRSPRR